MSDEDDDGSRSTPGGRKLPKSGKVLRGIRLSDGVTVSQRSTVERGYLQKFKDRTPGKEMEYAHLQGTRDHYAQKKRWSAFLMTTVAGMLVFQSVLLWKVGDGTLDFSEYDWLLPALLVQNLAQVVGLATYAVKFLFSDIRGKSD